jgi:hypothetical protein
MMSSRGMGDISPSKMPKGVKKERRDDTDFKQYAKGGKVKRFDEGGGVDALKLSPRSVSESDYDTKFNAKPLGGMSSKEQKAIFGRLSASKKLDRDSELSAYLDAGLSKREGDRLRANLGGVGVNYTRQFDEGGKVNAAGNYTKPSLRKRIVSQVKAAATQGTGAGQWSARKAQLVAKKYKAAGGGYRD